MVQQETLDRVIDYVQKIPKRPGIDLKIVEKGWFIFYLHREVEILFDTYVANRYGISTRHLETIEALFHNQDKTITPAQLAEEVHLTRSAMTSNLDSLERKGYLTRKIYPNDRRKIMINLTKKGITLCNRIMPERYRDMARLAKGVSDEAMETLDIMYNRILQNLREMMTERDK